MMSMPFLTMDDVKLKGRTVLLRVDINLGIERGKLEVSDRLVEHAKTIRELSKKKAKVVVLAHQGRAGDKDFISLEKHATLLSKYIGKKVMFIDETIGMSARNAIRKLRNGQILLLENVRFLAEESLELSPEQHANSILVQRLSKLADIFVLDAFSASHRSHASIVGFTKTLKTVAGRVMEKEIKNLEKFSKFERPCIYLLGGAKIDECIKLMKYAASLRNVDRILTSGILGELCLLAKNIDIGKKKELIEKDGKLKFLPDIRLLMDSGLIETPVDIAYSDNGRNEVDVENAKNIDKPSFDIGSKTIEKYKAMLAGAKTIYIKGPLGVYEEKPFEDGTREILKAAISSGAFVLAGGGNTLSAIEKFKVDKKNLHISLAGGALLSYLSGEKLPGIEALKNAKRK